jgi:transcriptional regulator with XRE-family HTH domain
MSKTPESPFTNLGSQLKRMREKRQESLAEVSGAVEIEVDALSQIESGTARPSEDILLLLISHFAVKEDEATKLWELAGYDHALLPVEGASQDGNGEATQAVMVMPVDARVVYTDMVHVMVNNYGVVVNFMQATGPNNQPLAVARVGMSKEHAKSVIEVLQRTLDQSEQRSLPAPGQDKSQPPKQQKSSSTD